MSFLVENHSIDHKNQKGIELWYIINRLAYSLPKTNVEICSEVL